MPTAPAAAAPPAAPAAAPPPGQAPISPERARQISDWVAQKSDPNNDGFLWLSHHGSAEKVGNALGGRTELGPMTLDEQRSLTDGMLDRWASGQGEGANGPGSLARSLPDDPALRGVVGERIAQRAGTLAQRPPAAEPIQQFRDRTETAMYGQAAVQAASGPAGQPPGNLAPLRDMVGRLGPQGAAGLAQALNPDRAGLSPPGQLDPGRGGLADGNAEMTARTLAALNGGPRTDGGSAFVQNAFAVATPQAYSLASTPLPGTMQPRSATGTPDLRTEMGTALGREWNPDNPAAAAADGQRMRDILQTNQGVGLLAARTDGPGLDARVNALATLRLHPEITADTLRQTPDAWTNPAITGPAAQAFAQPFLARGDTPVPLRGSDLDNTVGTAMGQAPVVPPGMTPEQAEAGLAQGNANFFTDNSAVRPVSDAIRQAGGPEARVTVLPVTYSSGQTGPVRVPLFRVDTPAGQQFVDNQGRTYRSFEHWRTTNVLPPGNMQYPRDGQLAARPDGQVLLDQGNTPKTVDTFGEHLAQVGDGAALVGGVVATGLVIAGTGGTAALALGAGAAAWGVGRGVNDLADRSDHGQTLNPVTNAEARGIWLGLAANTAAVGAFGSAARLAQLGRAGEAISPLEASLHGYVQAGANLTNVAAIGNQGVDLARNWGSMTPEDRAKAALQIGFWGAASVAGARASGARPGEMFSPVAVRDSLLQTYAPPVRPDPTLRGNAVRIVADRTGAVQEILTGPQATAADIALHQRHAQLAQRTGTLEARVADLLRGDAGPRPGSEGWAARLDLMKMREVNATRAQELNSPNLTPARRAEIEQGLAANEQYMAELAGRVGSFERSRGTVTIDQPSSLPPGYRVAERSDADLVTDQVATPRSGETQEQASARASEATQEVALRQIFRTRDQLSSTLRVGLREDDLANQALGAHTVERHLDLALGRSGAPPGTRTVEGRIFGDPPWSKPANFSYRWSDEATMNRTINEHLEANWGTIRDSLAIDGSYRVTFDAGHAIGEGYYNSGMMGTGPRSAVYHRTSLVTLQLRLAPGNPPRPFVVTAFPAGTAAGH